MSFLMHRDLTTPVQGLDQFPREEWSFVPAVFQVYHLMVAMWVLMFIGAAFGIYCWRKNRWKMHPLLLKFLVIAVIFPQLANVGGWYSTCMGRQPWLVYKLMKTKDAYSLVLTKGQVIGSLMMFVVMYLLFFALFLLLLDKKIKNGPDVIEEELPYRDVFKK